MFFFLLLHETVGCGVLEAGMVGLASYSMHCEVLVGVPNRFGLGIVDS